LSETGDAAIAAEKGGAAIAAEKGDAAIAAEKGGTATAAEKADAAIAAEKGGAAAEAEKGDAAIAAEKGGAATAAEKGDAATAAAKGGAATAAEKGDAATAAEKGGAATAARAIASIDEARANAGADVEKGDAATVNAAETVDAAGAVSPGASAPKPTEDVAKVQVPLDQDSLVDDISVCAEHPLFAEFQKRAGDNILFFAEDDDPATHLANMISFCDFLESMGQQRPIDLSCYGANPSGSGDGTSGSPNAGQTAAIGAADIETEREFPQKENPWSKVSFENVAKDTAGAPVTC
jgi:hypothetical protein